MTDELARWELEKLPVLKFPGDRRLLQLSIHMQVSAHVGSVCRVYEKKQVPPTAQCLD